MTKSFNGTIRSVPFPKVIMAATPYGSLPILLPNRQRIVIHGVSPPKTISFTIILLFKFSVKC